MRTVRPFVLILIPLLFSCVPKKPEMSGTEVPSGPVVAALERQQQAFAGLKAMADIEVIRRGARSFFENAGIVLDGQRRFRIETYGPLGQTLFAIVWDGEAVHMRLPGEDHVIHRGPAGLAKYLGEGMEAQELSALLSGNLPMETPFSHARLSCGTSSECTLELSRNERVRRVGISYQATGEPPIPRMISQELYESGRLVYQALFFGSEGTPLKRVPRKIVIHNPDENVRITVEYGDIDVNCTITDEVFVLQDEDAGGGTK